MTTVAIKQGKGNKSLLKNLILIAIVIGLAVLPLLMLKDAEFAGADDKAGKAIMEINADYKPWFSSIIEPKSGEIASLLFALQAAIGSGIVFYVLGYMVGRKKKEEAAKNDKH